MHIQNSHPASPLSISKNYLVYSEIVSVTSAMRKNSRWKSSGARPGPGRDSALATSMGLRRGMSSTPDPEGRRSERRESDLWAAFEELKREVREVDDISALPLPAILSPFLSLIRSPLATGPITSSAFSSLHALFTSHIITPASPSLIPALTDLSSAISHCQFEPSDASGDEVVLLRMLSVIEDCVCGDVGYLLGDVEVCELLETVLTVCCQMRSSEVLRRSAELTMQSLVHTVFSRLKELDPEAEERKLKQAQDEEIGGEGVKMKLQTSAVGTVVEERDTSVSPQSTALVTSEPDSVEEPLAELKSEESAPSPTIEATPYGLVSINELLRVVINLLDPTNQKHTDSMRSVGLSILSLALEISGSQIDLLPSLRGLIADQGCKFLFQLARSENISILQMGLRIITTLFGTMPAHLKLQQELFLTFTIDKLTPPPLPLVPKLQNSLNTPSISEKSRVSSSSRPTTPLPGYSSPSLNGTEKQSFDLSIETPPPTPRPGVLPARGEVKELMLETLGHLSRHPSFMVDLWVNYDCDVDCEDVFERLVGFLTKAIYPSQNFGSGGFESQTYTSQFMCLDLLLSFVNHMAARSESSEDVWPLSNPTPSDLLQSKARKRLLLTGSARFNTKPKLGLSFLEENGMIQRNPKSIATFLKNGPRLDKKLIGDFISKPDNEDILNEFIGLFDFRGKPIAEAMRELLEAFRLPGEAQQIARITETFAKCYFASGPAEVKSEEAVYVLAYSVIMLNTDLYNPQNRKRMSLLDYQRNLRNVNEQSDFSPEFLEAIYTSIKTREIVLPQEHTGQLGFDYAWKELLQRTITAGPLLQCNTSKFDVSMFKLSWKPVISAIAYAFTSFDDDYVMQRAISGFRQCATLAGKFKLPEVFDYIVMSLSHATGLIADEEGSRPKSLNFPVVEVEEQSVTVSTLSIKFGTNFRAQLAAVVLFTIANGNGNAIRDGWVQIFEMFQTLFLHSLLPNRMLGMEEFLGGASPIVLQGHTPAPAQPAPRSDGGLLSALSSYLMTPYGASSEVLIPDATDEDVESTLSAIDCIAACKLDELYIQIMALELDALSAALRALVVLADRRTVDKLQFLDTGDPATSPRSPREPAQLPYDAAAIFLLETMVSIASKTKEWIEDTWPIVFDYLSRLLSVANRFGILLIDRAVAGLLRLSLIVAEKSTLRDQLYVALDVLGGLPPTVFGSVAEQIIAGVAEILKGQKAVIRSQTEWGLIISLIRPTASNPSAANIALEVVADLVSPAEGDPTITQDNLIGIVSVLDEFATAAGTAVESRQKSRRSASAHPADPAVERGVKAVDLVFDLKKSIPRLVETSRLVPEEAWKALWLPPLVNLARHSASSCAEVRHQALSHLQRIVLGPNITPQSQPLDVNLLFDQVIFPLTEEMLKPRALTREMSETRLRASNLLCKSFLHFEIRPSNGTELRTGMQDLWMIILDFLDQIMNSGRRDQVYEAIPESLKNVVLVMHASQILVSPLTPDNRTPSQKAMWDSTKTRIERFLPGFLDEVLPKAETVVQSEPVTVAVPVAPTGA